MSILHACKVYHCIRVRWVEWWFLFILCLLKRDTCVTDCFFLLPPVCEGSYLLLSLTLPWPEATTSPPRRSLPSNIKQYNHGCQSLKGSWSVTFSIPSVVLWYYMPLYLSIVVQARYSGTRRWGYWCWGWMQLEKLVGQESWRSERAMLITRCFTAILYKLKLNQSVTTIPTGM